MPEKSFKYALEYEEDFEPRWNHIQTFLQNPPDPIFGTLQSMVSKLSRATASFGEVKEVRQKLMKLRADKEDTETAERINQSLQWKRIQKAYSLKEMDEKPSKSWYSRASTPLKLFTLYNIITREASHAPNTIPFNLRQNLLVYGGNILTKTPDLKEVPPTVDWSKN